MKQLSFFRTRRSSPPLPAPSVFTGLNNFLTMRTEPPVTQRRETFSGDSVLRVCLKHLLVLPVLIGLLPSSEAPAQTLTTLHNLSFGSEGGFPGGALVLSGNTLYGTAVRGGYGYGTVFKVNTDGTAFTNLHNFTSVSDGAIPQAGLILSGTTLYGTAYTGGSLSRGTVFAIHTDGTGFTNLHSFTDGSDGNFPSGTLILSGNTLYGTTQEGGSSGNGTVFSLNTNGSGFTILHHFTAGSGFPPSNSEGAFPYGGLVLMGNTLYGTAYHGGSFGKGSVFAVNIDGTGFTNLHSFTAFSTGTNSDGGNPTAGLIFFGNTLFGTAYRGGSGGNGTIFAINTNGSDFTVLYSFTGLSDGGYPNAGLILLGSTLYGTAARAGLDRGTVFAVNTNGTGFTNLHRFTALSGDFNTNSDGATPYAGLIASGNILFGAAYEGGSLGAGTVFKIQLPELPNQPPIAANLIPDQTGAYGTGFNFTFAANTFSDPDAGQALSYVASGQPLGISFTPATRTFSGTPTNTGSYPVTVAATDNGTPTMSTDDTFNLIVEKALLTVTAHSTNRVEGAANPVFTGGLVGVVNGDILTASFTTPATPASPPGLYPILASLNDPHGKLTNYVTMTNNATLTILAAPALALAPADVGLFSFTWPSSPGGFELESTDMLNPANWQSISNGISENGGTNTYVVTNSFIPPTRFFRLRKP